VNTRSEKEKRKKLKGKSKRAKEQETKLIPLRTSWVDIIRKGNNSEQAGTNQPLYIG
jgi:hypothetical protein